MYRTAIVTGAAGGIGYATVKRLLSDGYRVAAMDILPADHPAVTEKFGSLDGAFYFSGNLAKASDRLALVAFSVEKLGKIGLLVNVAGVAPKVRADLLEMTEESYDFVMDINTKGTLFLTQAVAKQMIADNERDENSLRGFIVNISSMSAYTSSTSRGEYCISKAGVTMITTLFADRLAGEGILVNEIRPGIIETGMTATVKAKYDRLIGEVGILPIARWGKPEDIANAVAALSSGILGYTTGQSVDVDGGFHIQRL